MNRTSAFVLTLATFLPTPAQAQARAPEPAARRWELEGYGGLSLGLEITGMEEAARALVKSQLTFMPTVAPKRRMYS